MTIKATIETIRFRNEENGWTAASVSYIEDGSGKERRLSVTGILPPLKIGMCMNITGQIEETKYGPTLRISSAEEARPSDLEGIEKYLASGLIKNIGPIFAKAIVSTFKEDTLDILDNNPERLAEVKGIGKKRVDSVIEAVKEQKAVRQIMIWLKRYDITNGLAAKIYKQYGNNAVGILEENPYRLADDIGGVGFKKADNVARLLGIPHESPFRLRSGVVAVLKDAAEQGHTCLPVHELSDRAASPDYLDVSNIVISQVFSDPLLQIEIEDELAALPLYHKAECGTARHIRRLLSREKELLPDMPDMQLLQQETGFEYSDEQQTAITCALQEGLLVITGGPGTGKTATTNAIIKELDRRNISVALAAPTGRAAKRMQEVTGRNAQTIHRLLEYGDGGFTRNEDFPLDAQAYIIDEASMIDTLLMNALLRAIPDNARVILVGDIDQLPSVGAGSVLRDIIDSHKVPTVRLTHIYRQAQMSRIIVNAHKINQGLTPQLEALPGTDFIFLQCEDKDILRNWIVELVANQIPQVNGFTPEQIQVLCPMRRDWDPIGSVVLNTLLQQKLNPTGEIVATKGETQFRAGDKIMQVKNNYDKDIFNGDIGTVVAKVTVEREDKAVLQAEFNGKEVYLKQKELDDVELAYACTIHKSQGSEYPVVVMPIHDSQFIMLKRNLLYTGITRAKQLCVIVGTKKAVMTAVNQEDTTKRYTTLKWRI